jgi:hypothetical protein
MQSNCVVPALSKVAWLTMPLHLLFNLSILPKTAKKYRDDHPGKVGLKSACGAQGVTLGHLHC